MINCQNAIADISSAPKSPKQFFNINSKLIVGGTLGALGLYIGKSKYDGYVNRINN